MLAGLSPAVVELDRVLRIARTRASGPGVVRVGLLNAASGVEVLSRAVALFEAEYAGSAVRLVTTPFEDRGPLRRREVDLVVTRLPLDQPDIVIGPVLCTGGDLSSHHSVGQAHPVRRRPSRRQCRAALPAARGQLIHPTVIPFAQHFQHPDVVVIPLRDLPPSACARALLKGDDSPARDVFTTVVEHLLTTA